MSWQGWVTSSFIALARLTLQRSRPIWGTPRLVVSKILNHVEPGVTQVYDRYSYEREKREALDAWAVRLEGIFANTRGLIDSRSIPIPRSKFRSNGSLRAAPVDHRSVLF